MKIRFFSTLLVTIPFLTLCPSFAQKNAKSKHPKNVILLIGDGMGAAQIYAGLTANKGSLNLE
ncbi:hypothetical protein QNI16_19975 [Cytophagaceae bacterium YF14B1]|uniref:Alkaline phosphatase n=1 Tax=Xanthocytophaga flava TaxID=3048013 RepID=A0AAE3U7C5_9BACT|nr:hypothetical protein [Xanthocytophaga flavus]MDJ1482789.1 hypothetical protein [Xanthocytophaga flavus]